MIYFIRGTESNRVKIGKADDPAKRLAGLQTGSPEKLEMLGTIEGDLAEEKQLHRRFKAYAIHGEWFNGHPDLIAEITSIFGSVHDLLYKVGLRAWLISGIAIRHGNQSSLRIFSLATISTLSPDPVATLRDADGSSSWTLIRSIEDVGKRPETWPVPVDRVRLLISGSRLVGVRAFVLNPRDPRMIFESSFEETPNRYADPPTNPTDDPRSPWIEAGSTVSHPHYGVGKVIVVYGFGPDKEARIAFGLVGEKRLNLSKSPLRLIDGPYAEQPSPGPVVAVARQSGWLIGGDRSGGTLGGLRGKGAGK